MRKFFVLGMMLSFVLMGSIGSAPAMPPKNWGGWKKEVINDLISRGLKPQIVHAVFDDMTFEPKVLEFDTNQPAAKMSFADYRKKALSTYRAKKGKGFYHANRKAVDLYATRYGVPGAVIVALLGIESDYGAYTGKHDVITSMASLAFAAKRDTHEATNKRRKLFYDELYYAVKMIQDGIRTKDNFKGSWAGASGINQHMPSSYYAKVVDGNGDGRKDIWSHDHLDDVFATTAHHLQSVGWKNGEKWGRRVRLPKGFDRKLIGNNIKKPLSFWHDKGVMKFDGSPLPVVQGMQGSIIAPDGVDGEVYIGYENFHAFRRWNRSDYFALVVGLLSDHIAAQ